MSEKEQSNIRVTPPRRFILSKSRILRGRRNFQNLFSDSMLIKSPLVNFRYTSLPNSQNEFKIGFIAPKKTGTAVRRNKAKRLMREAFRLNQHILTSEEGFNLHGVFIAKTTEFGFADIEQSIVTMLEELRNRLLSNKEIS